MINAIVYRRLSKIGRSRTGLGLESQSEICRVFAATNGIEIVADFSEEETGKGADALAQRPQLRAALELAKKMKATVLVAKLDRLSRDVEFVAGLLNQKVAFTCCDLGMDADPFLLHIYASLAQKEREYISLRTRQALAAKRARGETLGNLANFDKAKKRSLEVRSNMADTYAVNMEPLIRELQEDGVKSMTALAQCLNRRGYRTPRGSAFDGKAVKTALQRAEAVTA